MRRNAWVSLQVLTRLTSLLRRSASLVLVGAAVVVIFAAGSDAEAQTNYPLETTIVVTDANGDVVSGSDEVTVAQPLTVTANGWLPNTTITLSFICADGAVSPLGTFQSDASGVGREDFDVPLGAGGSCSLELTGLGSNGNPRAVEAPILVRVAGAAAVAPASKVAGSTLAAPFAKTGIDVWMLVQFAFALLAVGAVLVLAVRRRRLRVSVA